MLIQGIVNDGDNGVPVARASVEAWTGNLRISSTVADDNGVFSLDVPGSPDLIKITSASFSPGNFAWPAHSGNPVYTIYPNVVEGENVVVTATKKKKPALWVVGLMLAAALLLKDK